MALVRSPGSRMATSACSRVRATTLPCSIPNWHLCRGAIGASRALLDGEIVVLDEEGRSDFERMQQRMNVQRPSPDLCTRFPVTYYLVRSGPIAMATTCVRCPCSSARSSSGASSTPVARFASPIISWNAARTCLNWPGKIISKALSASASIASTSAPAVRIGSS